jgi:predicted ATP-grasp superfamily ATP-dependent carboligase
MSRVLVTDGEQRAALAVVRSLGRAGYEVAVCSSRARPLAGGSRYCSHEAVVPDALEDAPGFVTAAEALVRAGGIDVLIPVSEASLLALLPERQRLSGVRIPFPALEQFTAISDKRRVAAAARKVGIRAPAQLEVASPEALHRVADQLRFPLVIKSARSVIEVDGGRAKSEVVHVDGRASLEAALGRFPTAAYPLLLQERIVGPGVGVFLLIARGEVAAAFAHRRIREKPPSGGVSVYRASAPLDSQLLELSRALLREFDWEGVAMVEYKVDAATGTPCIIEINGRFWGSLQLAVDSGIDFPRLLLESGADGPTLRDYSVGVRSRWEWGDVDHLLARLLRSREALALPADAPGRGRALLDFLSAFGPGSRNEILQARDPIPFVRETLAWLRRQ